MTDDVMPAGLENPFLNKFLPLHSAHLLDDECEPVESGIRIVPPASRFELESVAELQRGEVLFIVCGKIEHAIAVDRPAIGQARSVREEVLQSNPPGDCPIPEIGEKFDETVFEGESSFAAEKKYPVSDKRFRDRSEVGHCSFRKAFSRDEIRRTYALFVERFVASLNEHRPSRAVLVHRRRKH
jgi:hypothetical protein